MAGIHCNYYILKFCSWLAWFSMLEVKIIYRPQAQKKDQNDDLGPLAVPLGHGVSLLFSAFAGKIAGE